VVREVGLLVYDEIHYLRDAERGVVWEESIILAPKGARMTFLSATLPNTAEFAGWVAATHGSPVHVVYTEYRPTPLQHYMFPAGARAAAAPRGGRAGGQGGRRCLPTRRPVGVGRGHASRGPGNLHHTTDLTTTPTTTIDTHTHPSRCGGHVPGRR
jgi:hypothetical protein